MLVDLILAAMPEQEGFTYTIGAVGKELFETNNEEWVSQLLMQLEIPHADQLLAEARQSGSVPLRLSE